MNTIPTELEDVLLIEPQTFGDPRGFFMETYHRDRYQAAGVRDEFCQDNLSFSCQGTLRGLHYQFPHAQAKLVQVLQGEIVDVAVDIRRGSPTFGRSVVVTLSGENRRQLFIPQGFAHGFCVLSATALFSYKCSDLYAPDCDRGVLWSDPDIAIDWPVANPLLSAKDAKLPRLRDIPADALPSYKEG
jgi:dTDP-4-dehydrorhamnose 3,5-epimerase